MSFYKLLYENAPVWRPQRYYSQGLNFAPNDMVTDPSIQVIMSDGSRERRRDMFVVWTKESLRWASGATKIAVVSIPADAKTEPFKMIGGIYTDRIFIEKVIDVKDWDGWHNVEFCADALRESKSVMSFVKADLKQVLAFQFPEYD